MTTYALPICEALAAQLAQAPTERPLEAEDAAAEVLAEMLQTDTHVDIESEPLDQATLDMLKERAEQAHAGTNLCTVEDYDARVQAAIQAGMNATPVSLLCVDTRRLPLLQ